MRPGPAEREKRSERWVSQVERHIQPIERIGVLRDLAAALGVSVHDLRPTPAPRHARRAYQAVAVAFARQDEPDAAWVAADRAITAAELAGDPLGPGRL